MIKPDAEATIIAQQAQTLPPLELQASTESKQENFVGFGQRVQANEIVIIDSRVENIEQLLNDSSSYNTSNTIEKSPQNLAQDADREAWVIIDLTQTDLSSAVMVSQNSGQRIAYIVDAEKDGIDQVSDILSQYNDLSAVHIFSHGASGALLLGAGRLTTNTLQQESRKVQNWGNALAKNGDILLYGCNVAEGEKGEQFVQELARLTQADVAASNDETGAQALGGDWDLEVATGAIERSLQVTNYQSILLDVTSKPGVAIVANSDLTSNASQLLEQGIKTLDLSAVTKDLTITIRASGVFSVKSGSFDINFDRKDSNGLENLVLGKGINTLIFEAKANIVGELSAPTGATLSLEYRGSDGSNNDVSIS
nr:DUF4347 domain-containing protein [sulfur-oxidizing endosymbiont of Gigantopelta aegis]